MHASLPPAFDGPPSTVLRPYGLVLPVLILVEIVAAFEASMIYAGLPTFYKQFGDPLLVGWIVTAYLLLSAGSAAIFARLGDIYGRLRVLLVVLALAGAGSLVSAFADSLVTIIIGRAIQGASGAILPLCFGLARENVPLRRLQFTVAVIGSSAAIGAGFGFLLGGLLIDHAGWRWLFYSSAGLAAVAACAAYIVLQNSRPAGIKGKLDALGGVLFAAGIGALLLGLSFGKAWGWADWRLLCMVTAGIVLLVVWARHEARLSNPLLNVRMFANRQIALANLAFFLLAVGSMNVAQVLMVLLQQPTWTGVGLGISATLAGALNFPGVLVALGAGTWGGVLAARHGGRATMLVAVGIVTFAWLVMTLLHREVYQVITMMMLAGFGVTIAYGATANLVIECTPSERISEATGLLQVTRATGMTVGSQVLSLLMASSTVGNASMGPRRFPDAQAYHLTLGFIALAAACALISTWLLPRPDATIKRTAALKPI